MNVIFEVSGKLYPLNEPAATVTGENLRRKAAGQLGDEGVEGAREVADEIELVLVGTSSEPIRLARERADAVFYVLNVTDRPDDPEEADAHALYLASGDSRRTAPVEVDNYSAERVIAKPLRH